MKKDNEEAALAGLMEVLPYLTGVRYKSLGCPDERNSSTPDVDCILQPVDAARPSVAAEHTTLEAFRGQRTDGFRSYGIVAAVDSKCRGHVPLDRYFILVVPHDLIARLRKGALEKFTVTASEWVTDVAGTLSVDDHIKMEYGDHTILLICGGSNPSMNGTIGRIPRRPDNHEELRAESLTVAIDHGIGKFSKYKQLGYDTVLVLEDISGGFHASALQSDDEARTNRMNFLIDYILAFVSYHDRMIVCNVWKERDMWHREVPYRRRFENFGGNWTPLK